MLLKLSWSRLSRNIISGSRFRHVSEKSHHRCQIGSFLLNWMKISLLLKSINGKVAIKNFFLLKWYCLRISRNIFSGSRCICVFEKNLQRFLIVLLLLNWVKILTFLKSIYWGVGTKSFLFLKWSWPRLSRNIFSGNGCIFISEKGQYKCLIGSFLLNWVKISKFLKSINGEVGLKKMFCYWIGVVVGSVKTYFMEVGAYVSLIRAIIGV